MMDLGTLGGTTSAAQMINMHGEMVGWTGMADGSHHAFFMTTNVLGGAVHMMDLNSMVPANSGWEMMEARAINSAGQIVGWGMHAGHTNAFLLTPVSGPVMTISPPAPQIVGPGESITLHMEVSANGPLTYQWMHDGTLVPGATNATLTLPSVGMLNTGRYAVTARNAVGTVASASAAAGMFSMTLVNGVAHLTVGAPVGSNFRIEHSEVLGSAANWQTMTNFTVMSSMSQISDPIPQALHARFYRAVMLP
jgi:uncharacterized membrane protein